MDALIVVAVLAVVAGVWLFIQKRKADAAKPVADPVKPPVAIVPVTPTTPVVPTTPTTPIVTPPASTGGGMTIIGGIPAGVGAGGSQTVDGAGQSGSGESRGSDFSSKTGGPNANLWNTNVAWRIGFSGPGSKSEWYDVDSARVGTVLVVDNPNYDVSVTIDGQPVDRGAAVPNTPGRHTIVATAAGGNVETNGARANIQLSIGA